MSFTDSDEELSMLADELVVDDKSTPISKRGRPRKHLDKVAYIKQYHKDHYDKEKSKQNYHKYVKRYKAGYDMLKELIIRYRLILPKDLRPKAMEIYESNLFEIYAQEEYQKQQQIRKELEAKKYLLNIRS